MCRHPKVAPPPHFVAVCDRHCHDDDDYLVMLESLAPIKKEVLYGQ